MADVQPFPGLRYNRELCRDLSALICPPYDVMSTEGQLHYHRRSPFNVVRLELGLERPGEDRYQGAATTLREWLRDGVLVAEERPALYVVEHRFPQGGALHRRLGLTARVRLEAPESGVVRPHEATTRSPGEDRLRLTRACQANVSPIMGMFRDQDGGLRALFPELERRSPDLVAEDDGGVGYAVWVVTEEQAIARARRFFADKAIYIADGHHRYLTALAYRDERRQGQRSPTGDEAYNFVMMGLSWAQDPALLTLPTHRLVHGLDAHDLERLDEGVAAHFQSEVLPLPGDLGTLNLGPGALQSGDTTPIAIYGRHGRHLCLLTARERDAIRDIVPASERGPLEEVDVYLLHRVVLGQALGIEGAEREAQHLEYTRDAAWAISRVDSGEYQLAFLLNPIPVASVLAVADSGHRMPRKSTHFYPKTPVGLVVNPLWAD